jgi:hypothetical protein
MIEKFMNNKNGKDSTSFNSLSLNNKINIDLNTLYQVKKTDSIFGVIDQKKCIINNHINNNIRLQNNCLNPRDKGNIDYQKILLNNYHRKIFNYLFKTNVICGNVEQKEIHTFQTSIQNNFSSQSQNKIDFTKNSIEKCSSNNLMKTYQNINPENDKNDVNLENNNQNSNLGNSHKQIITKKQHFISRIKIKCDDKIHPNNIINYTKKNSTDSALTKKVTTPYFKVKKISFQAKNKKLISKKRRRMMKNNKLVFLQFDQLDQRDEKDFENVEEAEKDEIEKFELLNLEKYNQSINNNKKSRRSRFRGVSKNGNHWQVLIMVKKVKKYLGSYSNEEEAARIYDKVALKYHGIKAKTNYNYSKEEIEKIVLS